MRAGAGSVPRGRHNKRRKGARSAKTLQAPFSFWLFSTQLSTGAGLQRIFSLRPLRGGPRRDRGDLGGRDVLVLAELPVAFLEAADDLAFDVFTDACLVKAGRQTEGGEEGLEPHDGFEGALAVGAVMHVEDAFAHLHELGLPSCR